MDFIYNRNSLDNRDKGLGNNEKYFRNFRKSCDNIDLDQTQYLQIETKHKSKSKIIDKYQVTIYNLI